MKKIFIIFLFIFNCLHANQIVHNRLALHNIKLLNHHQNHFSFLFMGDNRGGYNVLERILQKMNDDPSILFGIDGGDLVSGGYVKQYKHYLSIIERSPKPVLTVLGNHEIPWYGSESNYEHFMGKPYYSFHFGNSYFILLDDSNEEGLDLKQKNWLIMQLKKSQHYTNRFVFMHVPLYDPRKGRYAKGHSLKNLHNAAELNKLFDRYNVTMLFTSHIHLYFRGKWHKTPFIISGGAGAPLKHYKDKGFYHYIKININNDNVEYKVIQLNIAEPGFFQSIYSSALESIGLE